VLIPAQTPFRVALKTHVVTAHNLRAHAQELHRILTGDKVRFEMTPYELTKGRSLNRLK